MLSKAPGLDLHLYLEAGKKQRGNYPSHYLFAVLGRWTGVRRRRGCWRVQKERCLNG